MISPHNGRHPLEILGIDKSTSLSEARKKQRQFNLAHHPDRGVVDEITRDELSRINAFITKWAAAEREGIDFDFELGSPPIVEEDPFVEFEEQKREARNKAASKYPPKNGDDVRITKSIDLDKLNSDRTIKITVTGELKVSAFAGKSNFPIRIPENFKSGNTLKLNGKGKPGLFGGIDGDLYITLLIREEAPPPPRPTPPPPPPRPTPPSNNQDPDIFEIVTPVNEVGDKKKWQIGVAAVIIFIIIRLLSSHNSDSGSTTYSNQTSADQGIAQAPSDTGSGQTSTDSSGGQTSTDNSTTPSPQQTDAPIPDVGAGASGDLGNGSTSTPVAPQTQNSSDPGATGSL